MNYYVLFCQTVRTEKVCQILNKKDGVHAFIPKMEVYIHINGNIDLKTMFPGYLFIKTKMNQLEFSSFILFLDEEKKGIIKELKNKVFLL